MSEASPLPPVVSVIINNIPKAEFMAHAANYVYRPGTQVDSHLRRVMDEAGV